MEPLSVAKDAFYGWQSEWLICTGKRSHLETADSTTARPKLNINRHTIDRSIPIADQLFAFVYDRFPVQCKVDRRAAAGAPRRDAQSIDLCKQIWKQIRGVAIRVLQQPQYEVPLLLR